MGSVMWVIFQLTLVYTIIKMYRNQKNLLAEIKTLKDAASKFEDEKSKYVNDMSGRMVAFEEAIRKKHDDLKEKELSLEKEFEKKENELERKTKNEGDELNRMREGLNLREQRVLRTQVEVDKAQIEVAAAEKTLKEIQDNINDVVDERYKEVIKHKKREIEALEAEIACLGSRIVELEEQRVPLERLNLAVQQDIIAQRQDFETEMFKKRKAVLKLETKVLKALNGSKAVEVAKKRSKKQSVYKEQKLASSQAMMALEAKRVENERARQINEAKRIDAQIQGEREQTRRIEVLGQTNAVTAKLGEDAVKAVHKLAERPPVVNNTTYHINSNNKTKTVDNSDRRAITNTIDVKDSHGARVLGALPTSSTPALEFH